MIGLNIMICKTKPLHSSLANLGCKKYVVKPQYVDLNKIRQKCDLNVQCNKQVCKSSRHDRFLDWTFKSQIAKLFKLYVTNGEVIEV